MSARTTGLLLAGVGGIAVAGVIAYLWLSGSSGPVRLSLARTVPVSAELAGEPANARLHTDGPLGGFSGRPGGSVRAVDDYIRLTVAAAADEEAAQGIEVEELPPLPVPGESADAPAAPGFTFDAVIERARTLSGQSWRALPEPPQSAAALDYNQYRRIQLRNDSIQWRDEPDADYRVHFDPRGYLFPHRVAINLVENGEVTPRIWSPEDYDFFDVPVPEADRDQLGFAGFRVTTPLNSPGKYDELVSFRGASFFRALAAGTVYGASARGLAIATASPSGEEFPVFREFWIERPARQGDPMVIHALMDSPSTTGAFRFVIQPGHATVIDVEAVFVPRRRMANVGIAPLTSMYYFSPHDMRRGAQDFRPAVHDSEGLAMRLQNGEWAWRPLINPGRLEISSFASQPPLGFGLMQRSRDFEDYEDLEAHYHERPNVWITPGEGWGPGQLTLVEIPTENEYNDNIVVFWKPETPWEEGEPVRVSYRMHWSLGETLMPSVARVAATRTGIAPGSQRRVFVIEFESGNPGLFRDAEPRISVSSGEIRDAHLVENPETGGQRLIFELEPGAEDVAELRALLMRDGRPVSETWLYRWRAQ